MLLFCGISSIVISFIGGFLFGIIGGFIGLTLGILSVFLSIRNRIDPNKKNSSGGMVSGVIGSVLAVVTLMMFIIMPGEIKKQAKEKGLENLEKVVDGLKYGVVGMMNEADAQGIDQDIISEELKKLND